MSPSESKWVQVSPSESKWIQASPSESKWVQVKPSEHKWFQVNPSERQSSCPTLGGLVGIPKSRFQNMGMKFRDGGCVHALIATNSKPYWTRSDCKSIKSNWNRSKFRVLAPLLTKSTTGNHFSLLWRALSSLKEGRGMEHPTVSTPCECHYAGRLLDGTQFDSSYDRGQPTTFAPNQVIMVSCWFPFRIPKITFYKNRLLLNWNCWKQVGSDRKGYASSTRISEFHPHISKPWLWNLFCSVAFVPCLGSLSRVFQNSFGTGLMGRGWADAGWEVSASSKSIWLHVYGLELESLRLNIFLTTKSWICTLLFFPDTWIVIPGIWILVPGYLILGIFIPDTWYLILDTWTWEFWHLGFWFPVPSTWNRVSPHLATRAQRILGWILSMF